MKEIVISTTKKVSQTVTESMLASAVGSGAADVFSTPMMIAMMEKSAFLNLQEFLDEGESSVGIEINVKHTSATPLGMDVYAVSEIIAVDGKKVDFKIEAFDKCGKIGEATHSRFVIFAEKFIAKANSKLGE